MTLAVHKVTASVFVPELVVNSVSVPVFVKVGFTRVFAVEMNVMGGTCG